MVFFSSLYSLVSSLFFVGESQFVFNSFSLLLLFVPCEMHQATSLTTRLSSIPLIRSHCRNGKQREKHESIQRRYFGASMRIANAKYVSCRQFCMEAEGFGTNMHATRLQKNDEDDWNAVAQNGMANGPGGHSIHHLDGIHSRRYRTVARPNASITMRTAFTPFGLKQI